MTNSGTAVPAGQRNQADPARERPAFGTPDLYRENISQLLAGAEIYARIGQQYVGVADDAGLEHAVRCLVAQARAAVNLLTDLKNLEGDLAQRQEALDRRRLR